MKLKQCRFGCLFLSGLAMLAAAPAAIPAPTQATMPPIVAPIVATLDRADGGAGAPIHLHIRLTNTSDKGGYLVDEGRVFDWRPEVDWLGTDGLQKPVPARETSAGEEELREPNVTEHRRVVCFPPGAAQNFGPEVLSRLFDLSRHGVYVVRVSHTIFPDTSWKNGRILVSAPVKFRVQ